jgi:predicted ATPase
VLDNCEHVIDVAAALVRGLLERCPGMVVLATSREPLRIPGEYVFRVPSLSVPAIGDERAEAVRACEAVRLLVDRATLHAPGFAVESSNARAVAAVCRRLDGIPLAIELAAARLRTMAIGDIEARLGARFALLTGGSRVALPRQQTLQALIDWSHELLSDPERAGLARLSVFAGGFDLAAAEAVCAACGSDPTTIGDLIGSLVDKGLVQAEDHPAGIRYRLSETVREYAAAKLAARGDDEARVVGAAHRDHYLALAEASVHGLAGPDQVAWLKRLEPELDNLRAAQSWSLHDPDPEPGLRLCTARGRFGRLRGLHAETLEASTAQLRRPDASAPTSLRCAALIDAARSAWHLSGAHEAGAFAEQARAIAAQLGDDRLLAQALEQVGDVHRAQGDLELALTRFDEAVALARPLDDPLLTGWVLLGRAETLSNAGHDSRAVYDEAFELLRLSGDPSASAGALNSLGDIAVTAGDFGTARRYFGEALQSARHRGNSYGTAFLLRSLARVEYMDGNDLTARLLALEGLEFAHVHHHRGLTASALLCLALTTAASDPRYAAVLHGEADRLFEELGDQPDVPDNELRAQDHTRLRATLGDEGFEAAYNAGHAEPPAEIVRQALAARPLRPTPAVESR